LRNMKSGVTRRIRNPRLLSWTAPRELSPSPSPTPPEQQESTNIVRDILEYIWQKVSQSLSRSRSKSPSHVRQTPPEHPKAGLTIERLFGTRSGWRAPSRRSTVSSSKVPQLSTTTSCGQMVRTRAIDTPTGRTTSHWAESDASENKKYLIY
jgi:hypothetical protein